MNILKVDDNFEQLGYWTAVVIKGLSDQSKLIKRSQHLVDKLSADEFKTKCNSAYNKVFKAISDQDIAPLRELKTVEKGVLVKDLKQKSLLALNFLH
jgi:hypothetical protein